MIIIGILVFFSSLTLWLAKFSAQIIISAIYQMLATFQMPPVPTFEVSDHICVYSLLPVSLS